MASVKITELSSSGPLTGAEVLPIVQGNETVKVTVQEIANLGGGGGLEGSQYIYVAGNGTDIENAAELQAAYDLAKTMSPSASNRITVIAAPGNYKFPTTFEMDTEYIDLVSLTGNPDVVFDVDVADPVILSGFNITDIIHSLLIKSDNVYIKGISGKIISSPNFNIWWGVSTNYRTTIDIANNLPFVVVENCISGAFSFGSDYTFGSKSPIILSGTFINCKTGRYSMGMFGTASGAFINHVGIEDQDNYGYQVNYLSAESHFGGNGNASGYFENCKVGFNSFGGSGTASGTFINCFTRSQSFGWPSSLTGKLYYCCMMTGTFPTVTGVGRTYYCVDGNGDPNNQGFTPQNKL